MAPAIERIDFYNPQTGKPTNLQNSAVLRMLEEEEHRQRGGRAGLENDYGARPLRDVNWPPQEYLQNQQRASFKDVVIPGAKKVTWPPNYDDSGFAEQPAAQTQGGPEYTQGLQQNNYPPRQQSNPHQQTPAQYRPLKPLDVSSVASGSPLASPSLHQSPQGFRPGTPSKGWAPVHSPVATPNQPSWRSQAPLQQQQPQSNSSYAAHNSPLVSPPYAGQNPPSNSPYAAHNSPLVSSPYATQNPPSNSPYIAQNPQVNSPYAQSPTVAQTHAPNYQQNQAVAAQGQAAAYRPPVKQVEPPPSTITLRQEAPVSQAPPPVYKSQPTTATLKGGKHLRGDLKWPPEEVKERMQEEQQQLLELAKGPACRPRKQEKDYSRFFAEHALNSTYPGYKIPPGTQFYRPEYD